MIEPEFNSPIIEDNVRNQKLWRIGWAVKNMNYMERLWWALTGHHRYLTHKFWDRVKEVTDDKQ